MLATISLFTVATAATCVVPNPPYPGGTWKPGPEVYGMVEQQAVPITMSDGITTMADIWYPAVQGTTQRAPGSFPVLLVQNPYGPNIAIGPANPNYFVTRGYIYVLVDERGTTARSPAPVTADGQLFGPRRALDGVEAATFAAHLQGSNGNVGLFGCSWLGINQIFTAALAGPGSPIKAIAPLCAAMGYDAFFDGGVPSLALGNFAWVGSAIDATFGQQLLDEIQAGGDAAYNRDFWQQRDMIAATQHIVANGIPALLWSAWDGIDDQMPLQAYQALQNAYAGRSIYAPPTPGQQTTGRYQIVVEDGDHAAGRDKALLLEWYDRWLKNDPNGIDVTSTPMHLYEEGSGRWVNTASLPTAVSTPYHLGATNRLTAANPTTASSSTITWGPPAQAGTTVTFDSAPLAAPSSVAGPIGAEIWARSTNANLQLVATLQDLAPDGTATRIADGSLVGSLGAEDSSRSWTEADGRVIQPDHPFSGDTPLTPGSVYKLDIGLGTALHALGAGHRLRLVLATQAAADRCVNDLALGPPEPCVPTDPQKATLPGGEYTILSDPTTPSRINIALVDPYSLPAALACVTPESANIAEPVQWDGGTNGPRDPAADRTACEKG
ncbi:MAG: CocE/NonD family hydrolase C-terminal non-catalytic domain-containing protein [Acidimicrobiales bacterium]